MRLEERDKIHGIITRFLVEKGVLLWELFETCDLLRVTPVSTTKNRKTVVLHQNAERTSFWQ